MKNIKFLYRLIVLICLSVIISGCGNSDNNGDGTITLEWMTDETRGAAVDFIKEDIIAPYERENPGVKIKLIINSNSVDQHRQQLAAGAGSDIISVDGPMTLKRFARSGYLLPLDEYSTKYEWDNRFADWAYETGIYDGKLYGLPKELEALVVWYNKDLFKEKGWEVPGNLQELNALNDAIQAEGLIPFAFGSASYKAANEWWLSVVYNAYLGSDYFEEILEGNRPWTDEKVEEATDIWANMWSSGYISDKQSQAISSDEARALFDSQKAVMMLEGTWALATLEGEERPFEYDFFVMPAWGEGIETNLPLAIGESTAINAKTKHPEESADFLDWYYSMEVSEGLAEHGKVNPLKELDVSKMDLSPMIKKVFNEIDTYSDNNMVGYASWTYWPPKVQYYLWDNIEALFMGQLSTKEYLENAQKSMEEDKKDDMLHDF